MPQKQYLVMILIRVRVIRRYSEGKSTRKGGINHKIMGEASRTVRGDKRRRGDGIGGEVTDQGRRGRLGDRGDREGPSRTAKPP